MAECLCQSVGGKGTNKACNSRNPLLFWDARVLFTQIQVLSSSNTSATGFIENI